MSIPQSSLDSMKTLHRAFSLGLILLATGATFLVASHSARNTLGEAEDLMQILTVVVSVAAVIFGEKLFKKKLAAAKEQENKKIKLDLFKRGSVLQWIFLEIAAILSIAGFFMSTNYAYLALAICLIIYIILLAPSATKTTMLTGLTACDLALL